MKNLEIEYNTLLIEMSGRQSKIEKLAMDVLQKTLEENKVFKKAISDLESSKELVDVSGDEYPNIYNKTDLTQFIDVKSKFQRRIFAEFLREYHNVNVYFEIDALTISLGPCIIINEDGDVLDQDSGKWIISRKDYYGRAERNALIEIYMEKQGYFPSVVKYGRYGVIGYVDTQKKVKVSNE